MCADPGRAAVEQTFEPPEPAKSTEPVFESGSDNRRPYICPVCGGNGLVMQGFYAQTSGHWGTTGMTFETCRSCDSGVVWGPP